MVGRSNEQAPAIDARPLRPSAFHLTTCGMRTHMWLDYVPSLANIADLPSRGDFELLERLGARRVEVPVVGTADWHGPLAQWIDSAAAASS